MRLPEIQLDDRRFQDLVSEARLKITRSCPEWTEHNVSDPGITLIELFAWMTEMTIYRLNRVPDKLHVSLLELLGIRLDGPSAAQTSLRFRLPEVAKEPLTILAGTEVGTPRTATEESIIFQVDETFEVPAAVPAAYVLQRGGQVKSIGLADGVAKPAGADQLAFASPPAVGDALYLGFEESIGRLLIEVDVDASQARGAGVNPEDPPLRWEVSQGDNQWLEAEVLEDLTGGFNYGSGTVTLELPPRSAVQPLAGHRMHWIRCRIDDKTRHGGAATTYTQPPEIYSITAGVDRRPAARHARLPDHPRDRRRLRRHAGPDLPAAQLPGAQARVRRDARDPGPGVGRLVALGAARRLRRLDGVRPPLHARPRLGRDRVRPGDPRDRRRLDPVRRRAAEGRRAALHQVPPRRRAHRQRDRAARYRCSRARSPGSTRSPTPRRPSAASTPSSSSTRASARRWRSAAATARSPRRTSSSWPARPARAWRARSASRRSRAARCRCTSSRACTRRTASSTYEELIPDEALMTEVAEYLDERRLIGTTVQLLPCRFRGLSVVVNLQASPLADTARVEEDVAHALYTYLNPLVGGNPGGPGGGWTFGRALNQGELYGIVHAVDGVEFVKILRIYETNLETGEQSSKPAGTHIVLESDELMASGQHIVKATHRED